MTYQTIEALLDRMRNDLAELRARGSARRFFHGTYMRTTQAVGEEIERGGFRDADWLTRWDIAFAELYLDALEADRQGERVSGPWRVAFDAADQRPELPPVRHVLFGLNAHINYDLPQALLAVIIPADFDDPVVLRSRADDHTHVDDVLQARVGAEDDELTAVSRVTPLDRLLRPANRWATRRFLAEARAKVWHNAIALDRARRDGPARYAQRLAELERLSEARVRDLTAPGPVLLTLARRGFGVTLGTWPGPKPR
jgi:uncharacterized protein DUF5995